MKKPSGHTRSTGTPIGETGPVCVINAVMTEDVLGCESQGGPPPPSGLWVLSQGSLQEAFPPSLEVTSHNGYLPQCPLPLRSSARPSTQYVLTEIVFGGFVQQHPGLGSWPGIQVLGSMRPMGTINSLASLVCSHWLIPKCVSGTWFGSDQHSQLGWECNSISV